MAKVRQIFVWDGTRDLGPFRREELIEQIKAATVLPSHFFFEEGMTDWARVATLQCCARFLASDAQKQMLTRMGVEYDEYLTKDDVSRILEQQPATERQQALIDYLGLAVRPHPTKNEASDLIQAAKQDPKLVVASTLGTRTDSNFMPTCTRLNEGRSRIAEPKCCSKSTRTFDQTYLRVA